jgi:2,4-dienoyl-CoA reductase-like NADH-dependent reductase (Old Yellow Enzyme family)
VVATAATTRGIAGASASTVSVSGTLENGASSALVGSVGLSGEFIAGFAGESSQPTPIDGLVTRLEAQEFDLIAVGRALIVDPDWAAKVRAGRQDFTPFDRAALMTLA